MTHELDETRPPRELRSFGRRRGRRLSPRQQALLNDVLPDMRVDASAPCGRLPERESLGAKRQVWLEIGFGGGEHLLWHAERNPNVRFIGCEPFEDGVVKVLSAIKEKGLANIRLHADDARPLLRELPPASIARAFVLFPDPWPKARHAKRRLLSAEVLAELARVLEPGGELRIATDIPEYLRFTLFALRRVPSLAWTAQGPSDWRQRPPDWPGTRYEAKAIREGRRCYFLSLRRVPIEEKA